MKKARITAQMIVKNEENWIWYAIRSVLPEVEQFFIFDTASTDRTGDLIELIGSRKICFEKKGSADPQRLTELRNEMLRRTKTDWFILIDGDEVWKRKTVKGLHRFITNLDEDVHGIVMRTRNCVGDVYHYLPEEAGRYALLGRKGHLTIRVYRKLPDYAWKGIYPWESYTDKQGISLNDKPTHLRFYDGFYWHMTHLPRSSSRDKTHGFRKQKYEKGLEIESARDLPGVLRQKHPLSLFEPLRKRGRQYEFVAKIITPFKRLKRRLADE